MLSSHVMVSTDKMHTLETERQIRPHCTADHQSNHDNDRGGITDQKRAREEKDGRGVQPLRFCGFTDTPTIQDDSQAERQG